ncbi:TPA: hypothetical protein DD449_00580 [Candidatus Berkelbacteria bacterium]|uniref:Uncharacterized protein n=1 Tax=Berkelbacteria bacterium GW2011_GWE1_39_12 TaxID=1618337 RepID=A0A0G4B5S9_9BACT|nr:MAG: hypothetical protein UT28_C0001G0971 [Berkelbacteria bacterium GW2011_GWE1_39_12]HBO60166.1 hypothetical protein [Candidatus Berkelbacteria bacterium]
MGLRLYLFSLYSVAILSLGLWILLIINVNPFSAPSWIIVLVYTLLFCFFTGLFAIIGFYLKVWLSNREVIFSHLMPTLRQSALIAFSVVGLIFLIQVKSLNWWIACLFIIAVIMLELFFRSKK